MERPEPLWESILAGILLVVLIIMIFVGAAMLQEVENGSGKHIRGTHTGLEGGRGK